MPQRLAGAPLLSQPCFLASISSKETTFGLLRAVVFLAAGAFLAGAFLAGAGFGSGAVSRTGAGSGSSSTSSASSNHSSNGSACSSHRSFEMVRPSSAVMVYRLAGIFLSMSQARSSTIIPPGVNLEL
ncbi:hypothetical protein KGG72_gp23 [Streptomyces phage Salutena]|uniref:Uncharacterized protein n=1 Tax=Streptomyces phage Salutena TaxID=2767576 RepID=A0A7S6U1Q8_9CAUD|nr:hypothetical protein KGG72_gp23 [Streptomyces phage Salutena]QOV06153.1 hypothetical protein CPT_Salutena_023 [Streptomyces phage Salutena]